jgi:hypothetical protein
MFEKVVTFAPLRVICKKVVPSVDRSTLNPVSLFELSVQDRLIWPDEIAVALRFVGAAGVGIGVGVGVAVGVGVGVGVGVKAAFSVTGPFMVAEAGLFPPEYEPIPIPVQFANL